MDRYPVFHLRWILASALILLPGLAFSQGAPKTFHCPERLPDVQQTLPATPDGWEAGKQTIPLWLYSITLFDGSVAQNVALAPDERAKVGAKVVDSWDLDAASPRTLWLQCNYANTTITLAKPLGKGFRSCSATYDPQIRVGGEPTMEVLHCQ